MMASIASITGGDIIILLYTIVPLSLARYDFVIRMYDQGRPSIFCVKCPKLI